MKFLIVVWIITAITFWIITDRVIAWRYADLAEYKAVEQVQFEKEKQRASEIQWLIEHGTSPELFRPPVPAKPTPPTSTGGNDDQLNKL